MRPWSKQLSRMVVLSGRGLHGLRVLLAAAEARSVRRNRVLSRPSPHRVAEAAVSVAIVLLLLWLFVPVSPFAEPLFDALGLPSPTPIYECGAGRPTPTGCSIDMIGH